MGFNRLVDRQIDAMNPRTAGRHIPARLLTVQSVILFCLAGAAGFVGSTLLFWPNPWPLILSIPVLLFLCGYSYAKRFTRLCHYWLGTALMLSPIAAWIAIRGELSWTPVMLASVVFFWVGGFDILYACQDYEFDRQAGLHSIPAAWGVPAALRLALFSHLCMLIGLIGLWQVAQLGAVFLVGIGLVAILIVWEHALVRPLGHGSADQGFEFSLGERRVTATEPFPPDDPRDLLLRVGSADTDPHTGVNGEERAHDTKTLIRFDLGVTEGDGPSVASGAMTTTPACSGVPFSKMPTP